MNWVISQAILPSLTEYIIVPERQWSWPKRVGQWQRGQLLVTCLPCRSLWSSWGADQPLRDAPYPSPSKEAVCPPGQYILNKSPDRWPEVGQHAGSGVTECSCPLLLRHWFQDPGETPIHRCSRPLCKWHSTQILPQTAGYPQVICNTSRIVDAVNSCQHSKFKLVYAFWHFKKILSICWCLKAYWNPKIQWRSL